ncbi:MAG: hypothetical protein U0524_01955 [Candidatus Saccharimonadales bacterium]
MEDKPVRSSSIASSTRTQMPKSTAEKKTQKTASSDQKSPNIKYVGIAVIVMLAIGSSIFFYNKYQQSQQQLKNPQTALQAQTTELVNKVGELTALPDEAPTVATVSDVSKLANQSFFAGAKNGDKVLIFSKSKKAILYRPSENIIVNIAPLNIDSSSQTN